MIKNKTNKYLLFIGIFIVFVILPCATLSQVDLPGKDILLKEYLFPISSYIEVGAPDYNQGVECLGSKLYDGLYEEVSYITCDNLTDWQSADLIRQWDDGAAVFSSEISQFSYPFTVADQERYVFKVNVTNDSDDLSDLTREQIDFIFNDYATGNYTDYNNTSYTIDSLGNLTLLEYSTDNGIIEFDSNQKYDLFRSMVFSVAVGSFDDGGVETIEQKGYMIVKNNGSAEISEGEIVVGVLDVGEHIIYLNFLTDFYYDFSANLGDVPSYFKEFSNADLNDDNILDVNPVIHSVGIDAIKPADDVVGLRIYSDQENIAPRTWYQENVINAAGNIEDILVDGYRGVRDDRTVYVHAANLSESRVCLTGSNEGQLCETANADAICGAGNTCGIRRFFYTNIYVIAYNQSAQPSTINIFNQMFDNWIFNKNIISDDPLNAEKNKDKLRRDTVRKADLSQMERLINNYHSANGQYPELAAGTLVRNHSLSTWSSWQSTLGNQLGSALPVDPLNLMITEYRGPYNCTDSLESAYCQSFCEQNFYGCPTGKQCFNNAYCSICPLGYDAVSCWDDVNSLFAYDIHGKTCDPATGTGCCDPSIQGSFNLGGSECNYDGAYVYQYTSLEDGQAYLLNYRFEYTDISVCDPGQCAFGNKCYPAGSCLAGCDDQAENCGSCENPSYDTQADCEDPGIGNSTWNSMEQYRNLYCYLGTWRSACGDGFVQNQCGETCDYNSVFSDEESWCDLEYGLADWYNEKNVGSTCTSTCEVLIGGVDYDPPRYTQDLGDIDCGGYCGDFITQTIYNEECDEGPDIANLKKREDLGSAGVSQASQYLCSGVSGSEPEVKTGISCDHVRLLWLPDIIACSGFATDYPIPGPSFYNNNDNLISMSNSAYKYDINIDQSGSYVLKINAANIEEDLTKLTDEQIDYLLGLSQIPLAENTMMGIVTPERNLDIQGMGIITDPQEKYRIMRSLTYTVYVDGEDEANKIGHIIIPATNEAVGIQAGSISLGQLSSGPHSIYLHYASDWAIDLAWPGLNVIEGYFDNYDNTWLDKNSVIYDLSIFSPELGVGNCKSFGGYCGDGFVQIEQGEQCDIKDYDIPTPGETTNYLKNPSFEGYISPWQVTLGEGDLEENESFAGSRSLRLEMDPNLVGGLYRAQIQAQLNAPLISIGDNRNYQILNYIKTLQGSIEKITIQYALDHELASWSNEFEMDHDSSPIAEADDWFLYRKWMWRSNGNAVKFTYYSTDPATIIVTDNLKIRAWQDQKQQYDCRNNSLTGKLCEYVGGFCGDGIVQSAYGEQCDSRAGMRCDTVADCGADCNACFTTCQQCSDCNEFCAQSFCGDGMVQSPNSDGEDEICDWSSDPDCSRDCQHIKMGGDCDSSRPCDSGLSCTIRNFGDTDTKCLGARGATGCNNNNDCILGYYCNITNSKCEPEISTYLKYHPEDTDPVDLPSPPSPPGLSYDINITTCPYLVLTSSRQGFEVLIDRCTGIHWEAADNITQPNWLFYDAVNSGCVGANKLPNILELYSLVSQTNQGLFYSDKEALRLCPVSCQYAPNEDDLCSDCVDDNYIYWSSTCSKTSGTTCTHALAVNFKYGSIEEYAVVDLPETSHNDQAKFKIHCTKTSECLNGVIESGESCEFILDGANNLVEKNITDQCSNYGYDGGFLHCSPDTCNYRFENCYYDSQVNKSCQELCQEKANLSCLSVGLDIDDLSDYYDIAGRIFAFAQDGRMMDVAGDDSCDVKDIPEAENCDYVFQNKNRQCIDSVTGQIAPNISQYSYCNCAEPSALFLARQSSCVIESAQNVKPILCDNPLANNLCNGSFYQQVNFTSPIGSPKVLVTPYLVSDHPDCGWTMDSSVSYPANITANGFQLIAFGSPRPGSCEPDSGSMTNASTSWLAMSSECGALGNTGVVPDICDTGMTAKGLCQEVFYTQVSFSSGYFGSTPHVLVSPEAVSDSNALHDACVGGSTDQIQCFPTNISTSGFKLNCSGSPYAGCVAEEGYASHAQAGWLAIESRADCQVSSGHNIETTNCTGTLTNGVCSTDFYEDITFGVTFSQPPHIIVSPELVSSNPACAGGATDFISCYADNITSTGFRAYCSGSPVNDTICGAGTDSYHTQAKFGYIAVDRDCQSPSVQGPGIASGVCITGNVRSCGTDVGECVTGTERCVDGNWEGVCLGQTGSETEVCTLPPVDEDCDGYANEGCDCIDGAIEPCGVTDVGACQYGTRLCTNGVWGECSGNIDPQDEICDAQLLDEDCDGTVDEICSCENGTHRDCGPTTNDGLCEFGQETCQSGSWGDCTGSPVYPTTEVCDVAGLDENCDGAANEGCTCTDDQTEQCGSSIIGVCQYGTRTCGPLSGMTSGVWGPCVGNIEPSAEICDNSGNDYDCDGDAGLADSDCLCINDTTQSCYSGPIANRAVGECVEGLQTCENGQWDNDCIGDVYPSAEICDDGFDTDCDGNENNGC